MDQIHQFTGVFFLLSMELYLGEHPMLVALASDHRFAIRFSGGCTSRHHSLATLAS
jgi:hypothetical protein